MGRESGLRGDRMHAIESAFTASLGLTGGDSPEVDLLTKVLLTSCDLLRDAGITPKVAVLLHPDPPLVEVGQGEEGGRDGEGVVPFFLPGRNDGLDVGELEEADGGERVVERGDRMWG